jgi:hypothetical protein
MQSERMFTSKSNENKSQQINPLNAELNPIRHLLALVGARHIVRVSRVRVNDVQYVYEIHSHRRIILHRLLHKRLSSPVFISLNYSPT